MMNVAALIRLTDMRGDLDQEASELIIEAVREIMRQRERLVRVTAERDELRHQLFKHTGISHD